MKLNYKKQNSLRNISYYNLKIYKLHLFCKLILNGQNINSSKLNFNYMNNDINEKTKFKWTFYKRNLIVPLRILRYSLYFDLDKLKSINLKKIITNKLVVYNGKKLKPINIYKEMLKI